MLIRPGRDAIHHLVRMALDEDAPWGDLTSQTLIPASMRVTAQLVAREPGVLSGEDVFIAAMSLTDPAISTRFHRARWESFPGSHGPRHHRRARARRPAGRACRPQLCPAHVAASPHSLRSTYQPLQELEARIVDTRKTTPGLRLVERYAVRCGGGHNHRFSLSDAVMVKDNHLAILAANGAGNVTEALQSMRARLPHTTHVEVEVDRPEQIEAVLAAGADTILLDNFTTAQLSSAVAQIAGRALVEASGGITLARIREIAETGVDIISVGALTHSVRSLDLGLDIVPQ